MDDLFGPEFWVNYEPEAANDNVTDLNNVTASSDPYQDYISYQDHDLDIEHELVVEAAGFEEHRRNGDF